MGMEVIGIDMEAKLLSGRSELADIGIMGIDITESDICDLVSESITKPDRK